MNQLTILKRDEKRSRVYLAVEVLLGSGPIIGHIRDLSGQRCACRGLGRQRAS